MSKDKLVKQLTDLLAGKITKEDLAADRVYFNEQVKKGGEIVSEKTTYQGKEVKTAPKGALIFKEVKNYE